MRHWKIISAPPVVMLSYILLTWLVADVLSFSSTVFTTLGWVVFFAGIAVEVWAVKHFRDARTTINPLKVRDTSSLVTDGPFQYSRNPMYVGQAMLMLAATLGFGTLLGFAFMGLFVLYIDRAQIAREEQAMKEIFGEDFDDYAGRVRRWL